VARPNLTQIDTPFHRIATTMTITLLNTNPPSVLTTKTTIKAKSKKHKRRH
jgi:hypothetical protein